MSLAASYALRSCQKTWLLYQRTTWNATKKTPFSVKSRETPVCPHCGTELVYRDRIRRHYRKEGGDKVWFLLRRLKCPHCGSLHRELPDLLAPYKHYLSEIISGVLDGIVKPDDVDTEDYPCEQTMERWRKWLELNRSYIEGYLRSVGYRLLGFGEELLNSTVSLLEHMRSSLRSWLETMLRFVYNSGGFLEPFRQ